MQNLMLSGLLILIGSFFLIRNFIFFIDERKLIADLEKSYKGKLWINKFGLKKTISLSKYIFIPLGSFISIIFLAVGVLGFLSHFEFI